METSGAIYGVYKAYLQGPHRLNSPVYAQNSGFAADLAKP